jgi:hypothetical protein
MPSTQRHKTKIKAKTQIKEVFLMILFLKLQAKLRNLLERGK